MGGYRPFLTASRVDLFLGCSGFVALPWVSEYSEAAAAGTAQHEETLQPGALPRVFFDWFGCEPRFESAIAWDPDSGETLHLGDNIHREYDLPGPNWLSGTADACRVIGDVISVADLKTGRRQTRGSLGPPTGAGQLRLLAWILWQHTARLRRAAGRGEGWAPKRIRVAWLMQPADSDPFIEDGEIAAADLEAWAWNLARRCAHSRSGVPDLRPGDRCRYCPAFDACPPQGDSLRRLAESTSGPLSDEDAAAAYFAIAAGQKLIERGRRALRIYVERRVDAMRAAGVPASETGVPIGAGKALRLVTTARREIDVRRALASGLVPPEAATLSISQESIRRALLNANSARSVDAIMEELESAGAVSRLPNASYVDVVNLRQK